MKRTLFLAALVVWLLASPDLRAHHSFAVDYLEAETIVIEGEITEFRYRNPHAMVLVRAGDPQGHVAVYTAEWVAAGRLGQLGITAETLKPGDKVRIEGAPGRKAADHKVHLKEIDRPADGWRWGSGPDRRP